MNKPIDEAIYDKMFKRWVTDGKEQSYTAANPSTDSSLSIDDLVEAMSKVPPPEWMLVSPSGEVYAAKDPMEFVKVIAAKSNYLGVSPLPHPEDPK